MTRPYLTGRELSTSWAARTRVRTRVAPPAAVRSESHFRLSPHPPADHQPASREPRLRLAVYR